MRIISNGMGKFCLNDNSSDCRICNNGRRSTNSPINLKEFLDLKLLNYQDCSLCNIDYGYALHNLSYFGY